MKPASLRSNPPLHLFLSQLPRQTKRLVMALSDALIVPLALFLAIFLVAGPTKPAMNWLYVVAGLMCVPIFSLLGLYRTVVRFVGSPMVIAVLKGITFLTLLIGAASYLGTALSWPVLAVFWFIAITFVGGSRFAMRLYLLRQRQSGQRVAIYGAGGAGARLATALTGGQEFIPVAFIDDNVNLHGSDISGIQVHSPAELAQLIETLDISQVLMALPSVPRRRRREILAQLESLPLHVQTMPNFSDLISGRARVDEIREVDVEDLLGRDAVPPDKELLGACISGRSVMVTGAGGSIGSQLCRQILMLKPKRLVLFENSEPALYGIERDLRKIIEKEDFEIEVLPILGTVCDRVRATDVVRTFDVETVYHAAAYKHVPMVEHNMIEGVRNNIFGTWHMAEAAIAGGARTFVLISTDKAVSPTSVMGATKRFSEQVLKSLHERGSTTRFCMVRFGNVLASSGSVVPLFREQIRHGGPVTVTHPEVIRYFMTIPEAAQLVIQAGSMGAGGDVFVLDMGKPVRIDDLARRMIHLMGLSVRNEDQPDGDIEIAYTGLRPAEKLYEELLIGDNVMGTGHPMIMRAVEDRPPWAEVELLINRLLEATQASDCAVVRSLLLEGVRGYTPSSDIEDHVWHFRKAVDQGRKVAKNVTPLSAHRTH